MTIIPDVHGRDFWKQAIEDAASGKEIIFLGDYLDPYTHEGINPEEAITGLKEIIGFKKQYPDLVTLLIGNHDLIGYHTDKMEYCRTDLRNLDRIRNLFDANHDLFTMAARRDLYGKRFLFTHAGILRKWAEEPTVREVLGEGSQNIEYIVARLNHLWQIRDERLYDILNHIGQTRGGDSQAGSPVWADMDEWSRNRAEYPGYYQIFGHTQQWNEAVITAHWANLDCRKPFTLED